MRDTLLKLAERCEAATGADRELDAAIAHQHVGFFVRDEGHPLGRKCYDTHGIEVVLPRYTASLDAAMALVPDKARWTMRTKHPGDRNKKAAPFFAHIESHNFRAVTYGRGETWLTDILSGWDVSAWSATPALALCAASLRARAALQETNDGE